MNKNTFLTTLLLLNLHISFGQQIINPSVKSKTSFAIVVDETTYKHTKNEIEAYKKSVEKDGLATYIVYHDFKNPQEIKDILFQLYQQKEQPLEGAVFVGDIPIPMIREGQMLTSTFKMNEKLKWERSSVPSDRFYDDFDLKFDYIKQDENDTRSLYHYYKLSNTSPHFIEMDIYTARIKPPVNEERETAINQLKKYFKKIVAVRQENNSLNNMVMSTGHGYSSNSTLSWASDIITLRTSFPKLFTKGSSIKFLNYRNTNFLKNHLLTELMRDDLDVAYMTGHGTADLQLLNGYPDTSSPQGSMENVGRYIRSKMRIAKDKNRDLEETKIGFQNSLGLNDKLFADAFDETSIINDSIFNDNLDIHPRDLENVNVRFAYLNSCLTGSFQLNDYIAGYYPFSEGKNVVAIANSVGVLQDLWGTQQLGILQSGARVGHLLKKTAYLETHILGDPTFHFYNENASEINSLMGNKNTRKKEWETLLKTNDADLQAYALTELAKTANEKSFSKTLVHYFTTSPFESVRTQAYFLLRAYNNEYFRTVLALALYDNHEYLKRKALYDVNDIAEDAYIPMIVDLYFQDQNLARSQYKINWMMQFMNYDKMIAAFEEIDVSTIYNGLELRDIALKKIHYEKSKAHKQLAILNDKNLSEKELLSEIKSFRLYRYDAMVPDLINLLKDTSNTEQVRLALAEVLGWFGFSYQSPTIKKELNVLFDQEKSDVVKSQITKSLRSLDDVSKRPF